MQYVALWRSYEILYMQQKRTTNWQLH